MDLTHLSPIEQAALVALVRLGSRGDGRITKMEELMLATLEARFGADAYRQASAIVDDRITDETSLRALLIEVTSQEARELIYGTALQMMSMEMVDDSEDTILTIASDVWDLHPRFEGFPEEEEEGEGEGGSGKAGG